MTLGEKINAKIDVLASFSESPDCLSRPFGSVSALAANKEIARWAKDDGIEFFIDDLFNLRLRSSDFRPERKTFVVASHLDSVVDAGKFDGPLGFLIGYELLALSIRESMDLPFNLEVIGFSDEEGVRFQTTYLGSSAVAGVFDQAWLEKTDKNGISLDQALQHVDCQSKKISECAISKEKWLGYYEVHLEQGPVLQAQNLPVGLVTDIFGQARISFNLLGEAGHAGTVPMHLRKDALTGFAEFALALEAFAKAQDGNLVATIGECETLPGASNVIPGEMRASIDIRSHSVSLLDQSCLEIEEKLKRICEKRSISYRWQLVQKNAPVYCDSALKAVLREAMDSTLSKTLEMSSGAGHDGVAISKVAPICMLFVRCKDGISHNPAEYVAAEDINDAMEVSIEFLKKLKIAQNI